MGKTIKAVAMSLVFALLVQTIPANALTTGIETASTQQNTTQENAKQTKNQPKIIGELVDKREANVKQFRMDDGSIMVAEYKNPVHYQKNGKWVNIDNTLKDINDSDTTNESQKNDTLNDGYQNIDNSFNVRFKKTINKDNIVQIKTDKYQVTWGVMGSNPLFTTGTKIAEKKPYDEKNLTDVQKYNNKFTNLQNVNSGCTYYNVFPNVDLQYSLESQGVKEYIVLNKKGTQTSFDFKYTLNNLGMRQIDDGSIDVYDINDPSKIVYKIPKLTMLDNNGASSNDVSLKIKEENGIYTIQVIADKDWIYNDERVFPIKIDPAITTPFVRDNIHETYVSTINNVNHTNESILKVGNGSSSGTCEIFMYFDLPAMEKSSKIINAQLTLSPTSGQWDNLSDITPGLAIEAHETTVCPATATMTWNTKTAFDPKVIDYETVNTERRYNWDITKLANKWYSSGNTGLMLKCNDESSNTRFVSVFDSSDGGNYTGQYPFITFQYRNTSGLEDYWTYHKQDLGRSGTGYINDFSGNVVYSHTDIDMNGNRMPVSVSHVFGNDKVVSTSAYNGNIYAKYGNGWGLSAIQTLEPCDSTYRENGYYYFYTDGDGTKHYFYQTATDTYADEDGLNYTLTKIDEGELKYCITSKDGTTMKFDTYIGDGGFLRQIKDTNGNTMYFNYSPGTDGSCGRQNILRSITDGVGRVTTFEYGTNNYLTGIVDPSGRRTQFYYNNNNAGDCLERIVYPDGYDTLLYFDANKCIQTVVALGASSNRKRISYTYDNKTPYRVKSVTEVHDDGTTGNAISNIAYDYNQTSFTDNQGRTEIYQFNNYGNTVCTMDANGNASMYQYNNSKDSKSNKMSSAGNAYKTINNLIDNPNIESGVSDTWTYDTLIPGISYSVNRVSDTSYMGNGSIRVDIGTATPVAGLRQQISLPSGYNGNYTLSAYVKTSNVVDSGTDSGAGVIVVTYAGGVQQGIYKSTLLKGTSDSSIDNGWQRVYVTFSSSNIDSVKVFGAISNTTGSAWFDCFQLETGDAANKFNLINNGSFERGNGSTINAWVTNNFDVLGDGYTWSNGNSYSRDGNYSCRIVGEAGKSKSIAQTVYVKGNEGDVYSLSAFSVAYAVPNRAFRISAAIIYDDGHVEWRDVDFNQNINGWQYASGMISTDDKDSSTKRTYSRIDIYIYYNNQQNEAFFDSVQFTKDDGQSYQYDSNGNLVSTADAATTDSSFSYNNDNLSKMVNPDGTSYEYQYDDKKNVTNAKSSEGVKYGFTYDSYGNPLTSEMRNDSNSTSITSGKTYYIRNKNSGKYLDNDGSQIVQMAYNGNTSQQWKVIITELGYYKLIPQNSTSQALDVTGASSSNGTHLELYAVNNSVAQRFKFVVNTDGSYRILTKCSDDTGAITIPSGNLSDWAQADQWAYGNGIDQMWYFEPAEKVSSTTKWDTPTNDSVYYIRSALTGQYIDVAGSSNTTLTAINQYYLNGGSNQQFKLVTDDNVYYRLVAQNSPDSKVVDYIYGNGSVVLYNNYSATTQQFKITSNSDGTYRLTTRYSGDASCLTVTNSSYSAGTNLSVSANSSGANQQWIFEKVSDKIKSSSTYSSTGNYLTSVTDAKGYTTNYSYDEGKGTLTSVAAPGETDSTKTTYGYDPNTDALTSVSKNDGTRTVTNSYHYSYDNLDTITHNGFNYTFGYDKWGNNTTVNVGTQNLITNTYKANNGLLDYSTYGNGNTVGYTYDAYDRITEKKYNGTVKFKYTYDNLGNLFNNSDLVNNVSYNYNYDFIGRLSSVFGSNGHKMLYAYDSKNRLSSFTNLINGFVNKISYIFGDPSTYPTQRPGLIYGVKINDTQRLAYSYDDLSRLSTKTLKLASDYNTTYTYSNSSAADSIDFNANSVVGTVAGDFIGGGSKCIATVSDAGNSSIKIDVWTGDGTSYTYKSTWNVTTSYEPSRIMKVLANDFNNDGKCDIAIIYHNADNATSINVFTSTGSSFNSYSTWMYSTSLPASSAVGFVAGDFNNDGRCDIAEVHDNAGLSTSINVFTNSGGNSFNGWTTWACNSGYLATRVKGVVAGNFNSDSICDIAMVYDNAGTSTSINVFTSTGSSFNGYVTWSNSPAYYSSNVKGVVSGYFNSGTLSDIAMIYDNGNNSTSINIFTSTGSSFNAYQTWYNSGNGGYDSSMIGNRVVSSDCDSNGYADVFVFFNVSTNVTSIHGWKNNGSSLALNLDMWNSNRAYNGTATTTLLGSIKNGSNAAISYTYDAKGNISTISENGMLKVSYTYDNLNQLTRENNQYINKTITYAYDAGGNITSKTEYAYTMGTLGTATVTHTYGYGDTNWKDKLTSYDGNTITYDAIGNPLTYNGWSYTWEAGRQLAGMSNAGNTISYKYNDSGIRTSKTVNGVTTTYYLNGDSVVSETNGADTFNYYYDDKGDLIGFNLKNSTYPSGKDFYYIRNGQNDIIGILDSNGVQVVSYVYDSWGKLTSTTGTLASTVGVKNSYRYRGYRYDAETGLYYLNSRYYDPGTGRWINTDNTDMLLNAQGNLLENNLYTYCFNNPINYFDPNGFSAASIAQSFISRTAAASLSTLIASAALLYAKVTAFLSMIMPYLIVGAAILAAAVVAAVVFYAVKKAKAANIAAIGNIARSYGRLKCKEAADAIKKELLKRKQHGAIIQLFFPKAYRGFVGSEKTGGSIAVSENGTHYGVLYNGRAYCNIYPEGLPEKQWINSFFDAFGNKPVVSKIPF